MATTILVRFFVRGRGGLLVIASWSSRSGAKIARGLPYASFTQGV